MRNRYMRGVEEQSALALRRSAERLERGLVRRAHIEALENRTLLSVTIINGGGLGYVGRGGGGPPDVTGAAGPSSYLEINNNAVTLFNKPGGGVIAQQNINTFFFNPAIGNESLIYNPTFNIAASPGGATESGTTVTITTTVPNGFVTGQSVSVSGVGVAGYNGFVKITGTPTTTSFTYNAAPGLGNSGGGTVTGSSCGTCDSTGVFDNVMGIDGRFIIGDIDVEVNQNVGQYLLAVSKTSNPTTFTTADWNFYHITTTEGSGGPSSTSWSDYPGNPGFNKDAFVETFNMFGGGPNGTQVVTVNATDLANGVSQAALHVFKNDVPGGAQNYRPVTMQDSVTGDPMWLVHDHGDGNNVDVVKMTNVLSNSASFSATSLGLPGPLKFNESGIGNPLNPDDTAAIDGDDDSGIGIENPGGTGSFDPGNRILKAGEYNNIIVASHAVATLGGTNSLASAQANDKNGNPLGGSGYTIGDILTVNGGTFTTAATLKVTGIGAGGIITTASVVNPGSYTSLSGINGSVSGGTGSGAFFSLFFSGQLVAQWYAFDVSSGTPTFQIVGGSPNVGRIGFGNNTYVFEPSININPSGEIGLGFMESDTVGGAVNAATGGFISTFVTARLSGDPAGSMDAPVLVPAGTGTAVINGRIGDFSGVAVDPQNGTFWHVNEFGGFGGPTDIANFTPEAKPVVTSPPDQTGVEGASKAFNVGSFVDPDGSPWTVKVAWGDGVTDTFTRGSDGSLGTRTHTYAEEGPYVVTVTVTDNTLLSDSKTFNINVSDPSVIGTAVPVTAVEGQNTGSITVATFTDPGGPEVVGDYSATIDWGDGTTTSGAIILSSGVYSVMGNHTYAEESAPDHPGSNPYAMVVTIKHETSPDTTVNNSVTVSDPAVAATGGFTFTAVEGVPSATQTVATFTDPGGAEAVGDYSASIDWGDGTLATVGTITLSGGVYTVQGAHTYATGLGLPDDFGNSFCDGTAPFYNKPIKVTISHESAPTSLAVSTAKISLAPDSAHLAGGSLIVVGTSADDKILITPVGNTGAVNVSVDNGGLGVFTLGSGGRIIVAAMAGNDDIQVAGGVRIPAVLYGATGDDRIKAGGGPTIEVGCDGNDELIGGNGGDLLIGGDGNDRIVAGNGNDILISGNVVDASLAEDTKFSDLVNILNGGSFNALAGTGQDTLNGGGGLDTFYVHIAGTGPFDRVLGNGGIMHNI
jgi:hypothetical protein